MEAQEEVVLKDEHDHDHMVMIRQNMMMMIKGKRTKRPRAPILVPPRVPLTNMASSSSSTGGGSGSGRGGGGGSGGGYVLTSPATSSTEITEIISTTEEEDMANCLILLAQGHLGRRRSPEPDSPATAVAAGNVKSGGGGGGLYVYQCKTCDRCFPSFQALGGHRASHKKPKTTPSNTDQERKTLSFQVVVDEDGQLVNGISTSTNTATTTSTALSLQISNNNKSKFHECSICGAGFTSGQALGGHMRRHRATSFMSAQTTTTTTSFTSSTNPDKSQELKKKTRNVLELDLNLPAPDEDRRETKFPFAAKEQVIVFSASPLVDCHY